METILGNSSRATNSNHPTTNNVSFQEPVQGRWQPESLLRTVGGSERMYSVICFLLLAMLVACVLAGCGSGGYAGGSVTGLSRSSATIDAGQAIPVTAQASAGLTLQWGLSGQTCSSAGCGTLSATSGSTVTYTAPAGLTSPIQVALVASVVGTSNQKTVAITVNPDPVINGNPPSATVGVAYTTALTATGGTPALKLTQSAGSLPAGLTFNPANGVISGTPTSSQQSTAVFQVVDSSDVPYTVTTPESIDVSAPSGNGVLTIAGDPPSGTVGSSYAAAFQATGGLQPYSWAIVSGTLPAGLTLGASTGLITGTPTTQGTFGFTVQVTDANSLRATASFTIAINATGQPLKLTTGTLPNGIVGTPYSATIGVSGGTSPYSCAITSGTLPAGLALGANCLVSGTPTTAGMTTVQVKATDSSSPQQSTNGPETITITTAVLTLTTGALPNGMVGTPYSATIGVSGGTSPYSCTITSGTLPAGLALGAGCLVSGTPTTAGKVTVQVKATDSSSPQQSTTGPETITITPAALTLTMGSLPNGTVGTPYSATIGVSGGTSPYSCTITSGTLPAGLTLGASCLVSGTPTTAGMVTVQVKATDSSNPQESVSGPESITITPAALSLTTGSLPNGMVGTPYSATIGVSGGTSPYSCTITSGTLPAGLMLGASCLVSGTPTTAGEVTVQVKATDSSNPQESTTGPESITISPATLSLSTGTLPNGTVGVGYSATIPVTGGTSPYSCTITSGTLPAGLALGAHCLVSGTPTTAETLTVQVKVTDSGSTPQTANGPETITISAATPTLTISSPPPAIVNLPYIGIVPVTGGTAPYTCLLVSGTLPAGLTLGSNCVITGTPTIAGAVTVTVKGTDSSEPANTVTGPITVTVSAATPILTISSPPDPVVGVPYQGTIPVTGGTPPYSCVLQAGSTMPPGLTLGANCVITGTPTTAGTYMPIITATDSGVPPSHVTGPVGITVLPPTTLTLNGSLPNAILGVFYTQTLHAEGGAAPYTYAITSGSLPAGITMSTGGVISGTPTAVGASSFTVTATDSESTPQTASLPLVLLVVYPTTPNDPLLKGPYAFLFQGYDDVVSGVLAYQTATVGSFTADGTGAIPSGELDANHQTTVSANTTIASQGLLGTYTIGADDRGSLTITTLKADGTVDATSTYAISVKAAVSPATISVAGSLIEFDDDQVVGTRGSGSFLAQTATAFTAGVSGSYAFGLSGETPCLPTCTAGLAAGPVASVGALNASTAGIVSGTADSNIAADNVASSVLSGSVGSADSNGRVQMNMSTSGTTNDLFPQDYAVYIVDANRAFILSTDRHAEYVLLAGSAQKQQVANFTAAQLSGDYVGYENSPTNPGLVGATLQNVLNLSTATIFRGTANGAGSCDTTNVDQGGTTALVNGLTGVGSGVPILNALLGTYSSAGTSTCVVATNGRVVLNYPAPNTVLSTTLALLGLPTTPPPARIVYLSSQNQGYFLESGYAGLGKLEQQTGSPFTTATLDGTYVYGTAPAASLASLNASGSFTANGAGQANTTLDENVGVGNINILELGVTGTFNYVLTDAAAGRFELGASTVVYAINPDRFVLLDESALTTSPSVSLIY